MDFSTVAQQYLAQSAAPAAQPSNLADGAMGSLLAGAEVVGPGILAAYLNARSPSEGKTYHESFGYPTDVLAGVGFGLVGFIMMMSGSKSGSHVLRVGVGCLAEAGIRMAFEKGVSDRSDEQTKQIVAGTVKGKLRAVPQNAQALTKDEVRSPFEAVR